MPRRRASQPSKPTPLAPAETAVPTHFLHPHVAYRTMGAKAQMIGCGFGAFVGRGLANDHSVPQFYSGNIVLSGVGTYWDYRDQAYPMRPGTFFQRLPEREHTVHLEPGTPYAECWVHLSTPLFHTLTGLGVLSEQPPVLEVGLDLALIADWDAEVAALRDASERELPRHLLLLIGFIVTACARHSRGSDDDPHARMVDDACALLADDHADRRPLAALAARYHLSYERFRKVFRSRTGVSPGDYRIRRRIDRARELLLGDRTRSVTAIAELLGYSNPFIFSAQFKQLVGISPEAFRFNR
jgi:AraC-like DNA-binding protein